MFINSSFPKLSNAKKVKMRYLFPYRDDDRRIDVPHFTIFRKRLKTLFQRPNFIKHEKRFYWLLNLFCLIPKNKILKNRNRKKQNNKIIKLKSPIFINQIYFYNIIKVLCIFICLLIENFQRWQLHYHHVA